MLVVTPRTQRRQRQRGLSLVELMVGVAIGLIVVAAATMLVATQLADNRRLLLETQIQQDLRATADIIVREVRRSGYWARARQGVWTAGATPIVNAYSTLTSPSNTEVGFAYSSATEALEFLEDNAASAAETRGFRLNGAVIETFLGGGGWQALTDGTTLNVTELRVELDTVATTTMTCPKDCTGPGGPQACWPVATVRVVNVFIDGTAVTDSAVRRSVRSSARVRNELITGSCPA